MELDTHLTLREIHGTQDALVQCLLDVQECTTTRAEFSASTDDLRFIITPCARSDAETWFADPTPLHLTSRKSNISVKEYLAVSYCWASFEHDQNDRRHYAVQTESCIRPCRAPPDVLRRSIAYAIEHKIQYIWIDQECIEQDDTEEKEQTIQVMDIIYQRAWHSVAILDYEVETQLALDVLCGLHLSWSTFDSAENYALNLNHRPGATEFLQCLVMLSKDRWFTRNWTLQEARCSSRLELLLPFPKSLKHPAEMKRTIYDIIIDPTLLRRFFHSLTQFGKMPRLCDDMTILHLEHICNLFDGVSLEWTPIAAKQMDKRDNLLVIDRLAIFSNICGYKKRLRADAILAARHPYSSALLALSALNGCTWPFIDRGVLQYPPGELEEEFWLGKSVNTLLQASTTEQLHRRSVGGGEARLADVSLTQQGIQAKGQLWRIERKLDLKVALPHEEYLKAFKDVQSGIRMQDPYQLGQKYKPIHQVGPHYEDPFDRFCEDAMVGRSFHPCTGARDVELGSNFQRTILREFHTSLHATLCSYGLQSLSDAITTSLRERGREQPISYAWRDIGDAIEDNQRGVEELFYAVARDHLWYVTLHDDNNTSALFEFETEPTQIETQNAIFTSASTVQDDNPKDAKDHNYVLLHAVPDTNVTQEVKQLYNKGASSAVKMMWYDPYAPCQRYLFPWRKEE